MAKLTVRDFYRMFPTEEACLEKIFQIRFGNDKECPKCNKPASYRRVKTRRCYQCRHCYAQVYPTANTPLAKTRTPLQDWLFIIYLFTTTRNGVAAKEIERQLGVTYKCAWRMGHQIRLMMNEGFEGVTFSGTVELDETYWGGKAKNMHSKKRKQFKKGTGAINKIAVFGILERGTGVRIKVLNTNYVTGAMLQPIIKKQVQQGATVITDGHGAYNDLCKHYDHEIVNHQNNEYVRAGNIHTNGIEGVWSQLKRTIGGTHIQVNKKYLQLYANECAFRYNNVYRGGRMLETILGRIPSLTITNVFRIHQ